MSETQHTPTPYVSGRTGDADQRGDMLIMADLGNGRIESIGRLVNSHHKAVANAAFIVLACNAYDELVAACRAYRTLIVTVQERLIQYLCPDGSNDSDEVINDILGILDGPAWRAVDETGLATLAPVEKGDSSDPARTQR